MCLFSWVVTCPSMDFNLVEGIIPRGNLYEVRAWPWEVVNIHLQLQRVLGLNWTVCIKKEKIIHKLSKNSSTLVYRFIQWKDMLNSYKTPDLADAWPLIYQERKILSENDWLKILDYNLTIIISLRIIISESSEFYSISFEYLHPEIQSSKCSEF